MLEEQLLSHETATPFHSGLNSLNKSDEKEREMKQLLEEDQLRQYFYIFYYMYKGQRVERSGRGGT